MRRLVPLSVVTLLLAVCIAYPAMGGDILDTYGRQRTVPTQLATTVDGCKTIVLPGAFTDGGVGTNNLQPDASMVGGGDGSVLTTTCVTLALGQEYAVEARNGTVGCLSQTGKVYGSASTNCDGHKAISGAQAMRFSAAPDGGPPCVYAVSNSGTADKLDICPRVP